MAHLDHKEAFEELRSRTLEGIKKHFPVEGRTQLVDLEGLEVQDEAIHADDIRGQHAAKVEGATWAAPIFGTLVLKDKNSGKVIERKKLRLAELPMVTRRFSFIVDGQEWQVDNQWQLRPGVYTRWRQSGELETQFNVPNKQSFRVTFDPEKKLFLMDRGGSKAIPVYPLLKTLGVPDAALEKQWGKDIFEANKDARGTSGALAKFFKADRKRQPTSNEEAAKYLIDTMHASQLRPDVTEITLGSPFSNVSGDALARATTKMVNVYTKKEQPDDRDSLVFKDLRSAGDFAYDKLTNYATIRTLQNKIQRKLNNPTSTLRDIVRFDTFNEPIKQTFTNKGGLARTASQINPVEMISSSMRTTLMGPGGISSADKVKEEAKLVNNSHFGFLDPIHTPECHDAQTEVFTRRGWVRWPEVHDKDEFLCRSENRSFFARAERIIASRFRGRLFGMDNGKVAYLVTPNHRMWHRPTAARGKSTLRMERADQVHGRARLFPVAHSPVTGPSKPNFRIPRVKGDTKTLNVSSISMRLWAEFMGWFLSEGSVTFGTTRSVKVSISQNKKANPEEYERIRALLARLPFGPWGEEKDGRGFYNGRKQLASYLKQFGYCHEKHIPEYIFTASLEAREAFLEAMLLGDGRLFSTRKTTSRVKSYKQKVFTTTSSQLAADFEKLATIMGYSVRTAKYADHREERYLDVFEVRLLRHRERGAQPKKGHYFTELYEGEVFCATVPGGLLFTRRPGRLGVWSGNSENTGVTLHLPIGVKKIGNNPTIQLYNIQTGMVQHVPPKEFIKANVVLPDQVEWKNGKPIPRSETVKVSRIGNEIGEAKFSDAKYVMRHPWQLFDVTSNLIPFMGNTSGNRASYATHHIDQAISLEGREPPLVQVSTGSPTKGMRSFEELLGRHTGHLSPVTGKVVEIKKDAIIVADDAGKKHEVQIYKNFPLNDTKAVLDSTPTVHVGQTVRAGDSIADTNFTRGGKLALGTNLHVAYIPFKGYNFEDGVVISESAAKKLSSVHLHKPSTVIDEKTITTKSRFEAKHSEAFTKTQLRNIDDHGFVRPGTIVRPGDPLVLAMRPFELKDRLGREQIRKAALGAHTDASLKWDSDHTGEVVAVHKNKDGQVTVHVRTLEKMQVGDKLSGRYGNKGIVTLILPDNQMPKTQAGQHIEVALNPSGIPGRVNVGQVLETAAAKIAKKTGKPYIVENFEKTEDMLRKVQDDLKRHGLSDTEELIDPVTGINLGHVLTGPQHMLKLTHQVDKKISARAGMDLPGLAAEGYDRNLMPVGGGKTGAQSMGNLGMYVMLAHGAKSNIREMQTWKSEGPDPAPEGKRWPSQHEQVWNAIQTGDTLPVPKPTFAFQKFVDMLRVAGVNVEKKGHNLQIAPLTDAQVLKMSNGEIKHPGRLVEAKIDKATGEPKPIPGGLFDPTVTGGHGGRKWGHFTLAEPMPNPVFEGAIQKVLGMPEKDYTALVNGEKALNPSSHALVPLGTRGSIAGGPAIVRMLEGIDVKKELASAKKELDKFALTSDVARKSGSSKIDPLVKRVKYLNALDQLGMTAKEAYTMQHVPVLPPAMRPGTLSPDGNMQWADLNGLYKEVGELNEKMKNPAYKMYFGDEDKKEHRAGLYDGLKAIVGVGTNYTDRADKNKGVLLQISGRAPKMGYFQKTLLSRRQDLSMRSTIIPEPAMGLDQAGLPTDRALTLFRPFVVKKLVDLGAAKHPLEAQKLLASKEAVKDKQVLSALDQAMAERPILLKRDPALHKHSVMAFNAFRVPGRAIQIHPLVTGGFNADFDGDAMSVYVPIHPEAVQEAKNMVPSNNLFNEATGRVMHVPTLESALGLFKLTRINGDAGKSFTHPADALKAVESGKVGVDQLVDVKGIGKTTAGRLLVASVLPEQLQKKVITDHGMVLDKKGLGELYTSLAKDHRGDFGDAANRLKDLGYGAAFGAVKIPHPNHVGTAAIAIAENPKQGVKFLPIGTHTLSLKDFEPDRQTRDAVVHQTQAKVEAIRRSSSLTPEAKDQRIVEEWLAATKTMMSDHLKKAAAKPDNLYDMLRAGVKPGIEQYQQLKLGPMILQDATGRFIPTPVAKSYAEGLDVAGYWTQMHGARKGSVQKVQEVSDPGAFSKLLINTTLGLQVNGHDCKTARGIALPVDSKEIYDRELATDVTVRGRTFPRGTVLTPDVVGQIRAGDPAARLSVRSPLKCEHGRGLCQKCAGIAPNGRYYDVGTNLGVISSQSLGERAVQLTLKAFHTGGVAGADGNVLQGFGRIEQLTTLPKKFANEASLAMKSGVVEKLEKDKLGTTVVISGQKHFVPLDRGGRYLTEPITNLQKLTGESWPGLKVGQRVEAGETISDPTRTVINPHELYRATKKIDKVQNHLVNELYKIYSQEGVRRQHVETVVKGMSNLSRVIDPGDGQHILKGEYKPTSVIHALNQQLVNKGQRPVMVAPILQGINVLPLSVQEDWLAKLNFQRLRDTISESAATAALSDLHGTHPIPGAAYGAEFGMTQRHKLRAPHLVDVPDYSY